MLATNVESFQAESRSRDKGLEWRGQPLTVASVILLLGAKTSSKRWKHLKTHTRKSFSFSTSLARYSLLPQSGMFFRWPA